jgi:hypothetical protein
MSGIQGSPLFRPGIDQSYADYLGHASAATATTLSVFFEAATRYETVLAHFYNLEKPGTNSAGLTMLVSTNGATFETVAVYNYQVFGNASATVFSCGGGNAGAAIDLVGNIAAGGLATATGWGGGELMFYLRNPGATFRPMMSFEFWYSNSASSPTLRYGWANFASGPINGFQFVMSGQTFSCDVDVWGIKSPV